MKKAIAALLVLSFLVLCGCNANPKAKYNEYGEKAMKQLEAYLENPVVPTQERIIKWRLI